LRSWVAMYRRLVQLRRRPLLSCPEAAARDGREGHPRHARPALGPAVLGKDEGWRPMASRLRAALHFPLPFVVDLQDSKACVDKNESKPRPPGCYFSPLVARGRLSGQVENQDSGELVEPDSVHTIGIARSGARSWHSPIASQNPSKAKGRRFLVRDPTSSGGRRELGERDVARAFDQSLRNRHGCVREPSPATGRSERVHAQERWARALQ
jgi:hypothetical protein